jgi:hypothetical protein
MTLLAGDGSKPKLSPPQVLFWDTGIAFFIFLGCFLALEKDDVAAYLSGNTANTNSGWLGLGIVAFGSFLAFMFNIANYYFLLCVHAAANTARPLPLPALRLGAHS